MSVWMSPSVMYRHLQYGPSHNTTRDWENLGDFECKISLFFSLIRTSADFLFIITDSGGWLDSKATEEGQLELGYPCALPDVLPSLS